MSSGNTLQESSGGLKSSLASNPCLSDSPLALLYCVCFRSQFVVTQQVTTGIQVSGILQDPQWYTTSIF